MSKRSVVSQFPASLAPRVRTVGLDVSDRRTHACALDAAGQVLARWVMPTTAVGFTDGLAALDGRRVVLETGTHSPWIARLLATRGHEVIVAHSGRVALITQNLSKSDVVDAELLARLGQSDPTLLAPVQHRSEAAQVALTHVRARDVLVRVRAQLITATRGFVKSLGARLPSCTAEAFATTVRDAIPSALHAALTPLLELITAATAAVHHADRTLETLATTAYPATRTLRQIAGVGAVTALTYVLTLDDPRRFRTSRVVGSYLGLRPKRDASGDRDPECRVTRAGDHLLRRYLVNAAHYVLGPFGPDTDLRRWGLALAQRGGAAAKKRAVIAVARKLAVLLHRLWVTDATYIPLRTAV